MLFLRIWIVLARGEFIFQHDKISYSYVKADRANSRFDIRKDCIIRFINDEEKQQFLDGDLEINFLNEKLLFIKNSSKDIGIGRKLNEKELSEKIYTNNDKIYVKNDSYYYVDNSFLYAFNKGWSDNSNVDKDKNKLTIIYDFSKQPLSILFELKNIDDLTQRNVIKYFKKESDTNSGTTLSLIKTDKTIEFSIKGLEEEVYHKVNNNLDSNSNYYIAISTNGLIGNINVML